MLPDAASVLIVDDEPNICHSCVKILSKSGYHTEFALNGYEALKMLADRQYDVVVTDLKMSALGGMQVLARVKEACPDTLVIVITGYSTVSSAVEVMKMGAFDYLPKPFTPHELRAVVGQALAHRESRLKNRQLKNDTAAPRRVSHQLVGSSPKIKKVITMVEKVAPTDATVLIYGESGTGKELVARAVHANSSRADKVFFAVDCGTLSGSLLESELFGHVKGAYTGAHQDKAGIFRQADTGTVFLDEISNIGLDVQAKLLRFLETRELMPLGSTARHPVDVRLIFATNQHLEEMVRAGTFRQDFYYRIYVYPILLPPLKERREDILPIAYHFLDQFRRKMDKPVTGFADDAVTRLVEYGWPGNVRQLRNVVERAIILCDKETIGLKDLPLLSAISDIENLFDHTPTTNDALKAVKALIRQKAVARVECNFITHALASNDWNVTRAAKAVGMQRPNFQNLMKKHAISLPQRR
ncbi:sigma-54-dependent transcriptional regulator [Desulfosarcina sp.]|uniref:sigma-54-dependent transcriptional regulator n=1 Tax=Desulfosarcina sp. TaxID=2027861 RepID=UPI003970A954